MRSRFVRPILCLCLIVMVALPPPSAAQSGRFRLDIPAKPLAEALVDLAVQADASIGHPGLDLKNTEGRAVHGSFTLEQALDRLLGGTGFDFRIIDPQTVHIVRAGPAIERRPGRADTGPVKVEPLPLEEIVITATKRRGTVQSLPYSVALVTGAQLEYLEVPSFNELSFRFAGVSSTSQGPGRNKVFVRGLSDGAFTGRTQSTVGVYLDEVRLTYNAPSPNILLADIERIEVIRGPQGTLYGAGTIGGIYRIITRKPDLQAFAAALTTTGSTTRGGEKNGDVRAMFNLPLVEDRFGLRAVGYYRREGGFIDDSRLGLKNVNRGEIWGGRVSSRLNIAGNLTLTGGLNAQIIAFDDTHYFHAGGSRLERANFLQEPNDDDFLQYYGTLRAEFSWGEFVSSTSRIRRDIDEQFDATLAVPVITGLPVTPARFEEAREIRTVYHETRLRSPDRGRFRWLIGGLYSERTETFDSLLEISEEGIFGADADPENIVFGEERSDDVNEAAIFGEATLYITPRLSVTGGVRLFRSVLDVVSEADDVLGGGEIEVEGRNKKRGATPKFVVAFEADSDHMYYAQAAQGFRVGGININSPVVSFPDPDPDEEPNFSTFRSDVMWNFEAGAKTRWFDRRLVANLAVYYTSWRNIQSDQFLDNGFKFIVNAGDARSKGVELELLLRPTARMELQASFFWNDPELTKGNEFLGAEPDDRLPGIPELSLGLSGYYEWGLGPRLTAYLSGTYSYVGASSLTFDEDNAPKMGDYHIGNLRLGITGGRWRAGLFVNNLWDSQANIFAFGNPFSLGRVGQITPPRPRTIGLVIGLNY